jgi:chromosome segregation ATPase
VAGGATTPSTITGASSSIDITALMEQLTEAHNSQRDQERRIADLHEDCERRIREVQRNNELRVGDLQRELEQCRKREGALKSVFEREYQRAKEKISEEEGLEKKRKELHAKSATLRRERRELEERELEIGACSDHAGSLVDTFATHFLLGCDRRPAQDAPGGAEDAPRA